MRLQDQYDWIVLGNHPAALLGGGLAAQLGQSVLILPFSSSFILNVSSEGQPLDPESNYLLGLGKSGKSDGLLYS